MSSTLTHPRHRSKTEAPKRDTLSIIRSEMDDLLGRIWNGCEEGWFSSVFCPAADVAETDNAYQIRLDVPGMKAADIEVEVRGNLLTIAGHRKEDKEEKGKTFHRVERRTGKFSRTITLPANVQENEVAAEYEQGVLTVTLPKCDEGETKKIAVKG